MGRVWRKVTLRKAEWLTVCREVMRSLGKERCSSLKPRQSHSCLHVGRGDRCSKIHTYVLHWPLELTHRGNGNSQFQERNGVFLTRLMWRGEREIRRWGSLVLSEGCVCMYMLCMYLYLK